MLCGLMVILKLQLQNDGGVHEYCYMFKFFVLILRPSK